MEFFDTPDRLLARLLRSGDRPAVGGPGGSLSYRELAARAGGTRERLVARGVRPGDRVGLIGEGGPHWVAAFLGALAAGAVAVPLDPRLTAGELAPLLGDCAPAVLLCGSARLTETADLAARTAGASAPRLPLYEGEPGEDWTPATGRTAADAAILVYTSGTTGIPKGVTLSWRNIAYQLHAACERTRYDTGTSLVSVLPLHHMFELVAGCLLVLDAGGRIHYPGSLRVADIAAAIAREQATHLIAVPLLLTALRRHIEAELAAAPPAVREEIEAVRRDGTLDPDARRARLSSLHGRFGGRLRTLYAGGAALDVETAHFLTGLGFHVCQGYGLSEASPVLAVNTPEANRIGTVGTALSGTELRIGPDGEILARGPGVMLGYRGRDDLTAAAVDDDGWLHTGDIGALDADGYLTVTGRLKDLIVLPGGENVAPEEVELVLAGSSLIAEVCVLEDEDGRLAAVVSRADPATSQDAVVADLRKRSLRLSAFKRPNRYVVVEPPLPQTTSRKVRRDEVRKLLATRGSA